MPHAPPEFRAHGAVAHLQAFYEAFNVSPSDRMYRAPEARVRIW
jgi:predicted metalloendopeptidase